MSMNYKLQISSTPTTIPSIISILINLWNSSVDKVTENKDQDRGSWSFICQPLTQDTSFTLQDQSDIKWLTDILNTTYIISILNACQPDLRLYRQAYLIEIDGMYMTLRNKLNPLLHECILTNKHSSISSSSSSSMREKYQSIIESMLSSSSLLWDHSFSEQNLYLYIRKGVSTYHFKLRQIFLICLLLLIKHNLIDYYYMILQFYMMLSTRTNHMKKTSS